MKVEVSKKCLGTPILVTVHAHDEGRAREAMARAFEECERIEKCYSRFLIGNDLAAVNEAIGTWREVGAELYELIRFGERMKQRTQGAFDLSVRSILEGWGYDASYSLIEGLEGKTGAIELGEGCVKLSAPIELGGLGKGYAIDRMDSFLMDFPNVCINAGGDIRLRGFDDEKPWRIAFEHPQDTQKAIGLVESTNLALACSSPSRRSWGKRHHLVNPLKRVPANEMLAVYTQAPSALLADAYSTALFVLGYEKARALLPELPVEALLIGVEGQGYRSPGFQGELFN